MGNTSSVISPWDSPGIKSPSTADFEGNGTAVPLNSWKLLPDPEAARKKYVQEMTLMPNCTMDQLELRALLEDPLSFECVFLYAKSIGRVEMMLAWTGLVRMRRSKSKGLDRVESLMKFCRQYASNPLFNSPSTCTNAFVSGMAQIEGISRALNAEEAVEAVDRLLASLLCELLLCLEEHVFTDLFRCSEEYVAMCEKLREAYNCVRVEDFDCYDEVGEGSNAIVLHCRKRSTGQNYAMKIQPKAALLHHCRQNKYRVVLEVQAYARCRHPYIASIAYAMQTATLAIMVMPVAACGDLRRSLTHTGNDQMSFDRVQFYAAEIVSALCYLHSHGILYRDLKPGNVLLNDDGHIMLADFGSLADLDGLFVDNGDPMAGVRAELENSVSMRGATNSYSRGNGQNSSHSISLSRSDSFSLLFDSKPPLRKPSRDLNSTSTGMMSAGSMQSALQSGSAKQMMSVAESDDGSDKRAPPGGGPNQNSSLLVNNSNGNTGHGGDGDSISLANPRTQNQNSSSHQRDEVSSPTRHLPRNSREVDFVSARNAFRGRSKSLVGTLAYMAPEVVILFGRKKHQCAGYTEAIDWWSLGCTIYKLLTGTEPFRYISYEKLGMVFPNMLLQYPNSKEAHTAVFGTLDCSRHDDLLSKETIDLISRLLVFDADQRLGSGSRDDARKGEDVKRHAFFRGIDWIALEHKALPPPYVPHREVLHALLGDPGGTVASNGNPSAAVPVPVPVAAASNGRNGSGSRVIPPGPKRVFDMLKYCNKESWLGIPDQLTGKAGGGDGEGHTPSTASSHRRASRYCVPQEHQMFFREWNYVSPAAIELEMQKRNMDTNSSAGSQSAASVPSAMLGMVSQIVGAGQGESASGKCCRSPKSGGADVKYTPSGEVQVAPLTPPVVGDVGCAGQMRCFNSKP